jgi:hypothetical protein
VELLPGLEPGVKGASTQGTRPAAPPASSFEVTRATPRRSPGGADPLGAGRLTAHWWPHIQEGADHRGCQRPYGATPPTAIVLTTRAPSSPPTNTDADNRSPFRARARRSLFHRRCRKQYITLSGPTAPTALIPAELQASRAASAPYTSPSLWPSPASWQQLHRTFVVGGSRTRLRGSRFADELYAFTRQSAICAELRPQSSTKSKISG